MEKKFSLGVTPTLLIIFGFLVYCTTIVYTLQLGFDRPINSTVGLGYFVNFFANTLLIISVIGIYKLFKQISKYQTWDNRASKKIKNIIGLFALSAYVGTLSNEIVNLNKIYSITGSVELLIQEPSIYFKALVNFCLNPLTILSLMLLFFMSRFLEYTYFIKKENEKFI